MGRSCHHVLWLSSLLLQGGNLASAQPCMAPHQLHNRRSHCQSWVQGLCSPWCLPSHDHSLASTCCIFMYFCAFPFLTQHTRLVLVLSQTLYVSSLVGCCKAHDF
jgi:hypothetical protein